MVNQSQNHDPSSDDRKNRNQEQARHSHPEERIHKSSSKDASSTTTTAKDTVNTATASKDANSTRSNPRRPSRRPSRRPRRTRALNLDLFRELRNNRARFISLLFIVALGVAFYTGIRATAPDMRATADSYFDEQQLMDLRIVSTLGLRPEDVDSLAALDLVGEAMPAYSSDVYLELDATTQVVRIHNIPEGGAESGLNQALLIEGRWPEASNEVAVESTVLEENGYKIGDRLQLQLPEDSLFTESELTITASIESPYYISLEREPTMLGTGVLSYFLYSPISAFEADYYSEIFLSIKEASELNSYSSAYDERIATAIQAVEAILPEMIADRRNEIISEAEAELAPHIEDLEEAKTEAEREFSNARAELDLAWDDLASGRSERDEGLEALERLRANYEELSAAGMIEEAAALSIQIESIENDLALATIRLEEAETELNAAESELDTAIAEAEAEIADAESEIAEARQEIADIPQGEGLILDRDTNIGVITYGENAARIEAIGRVFPAIFFLVAAFISLTSMSRMVEDERSQIGTLKALGYTNWQTFRKYFYFALSASVIGGLIGAFFGLYFFPYVIIDAYGMLYSIPQYIIRIYPDLVLFGVLIASASTLGGVIIAAVPAVRLNPAALMRPPAPKPGKRIFLESVKPVWKRLSFSYKVSLRNMFRFKKRLFMTLFGIGGCTALMLTGFGIRDSVNAVVGDQFDSIFLYDLSIQIDSEEEGLIEEINGIMNEVDGETIMLNSYMQDVTVLASDADLDRPLRELTFTSGVSVMLAEDVEGFNQMYQLTAPYRNERFNLDDNEVIITVKLADRLGVQAGDQITIQRYQGVSGTAVSSSASKELFTDPLSLTVGHVAENYLGHFVFMSQDYFTSLGLDAGGIDAEANTDTDALAWNTIYIRNNALSDDAIADELATKLLSLDGVNQVTFVEEQARTFAMSMEQLDAVIVIIIIAAGLLAVLVLYNLNNINISERRREIATLKVLGFNRKELANYIYRENIFLMFIGIALGLVGGIFLHRYLITTVEVDLTRFGRIIKPLSWLYSVLLTVGFSLAVNLGMYKKIQDTDMVESLKSVE